MAQNWQDNGSNHSFTVIGLMSGTSLDGIDAALIKTDGVQVFEHGPVCSTTYETEFRDKLRTCLGQQTASADLIADFTRIQSDIVQDLLARNGLTPADINLIGFHGQTIFHDPANRITVQIGDGQLMADLTGIDTIAGFRVEDVAAGGEGAPFAPLYHQALSRGLDGPLAVLNLGGVGNVTYIEGDTVLAFDTGPANALVDDWVLRHTGRTYDEDGRLAATGTVNMQVLEQLMDHPYFDIAPPKSLDRDQFPTAAVQGLSLEDGAATLLRFTSESIRKSLAHLPAPPKRWLLTGGGRKNPELIRLISEAVAAPVGPVEDVGWRGDDLEAEAFAFLAVRSLKGLPLSLPTTTGVPKPMTGGTLYAASSSRLSSAG
ncbi:anhydro-N-acetylmuramic acid kinase [Sneathiella marina]|uniref:Anhydro-N-acetylmuramic acid kinase n=1 Tax=Sneathiella marina TaxID=2950108 RepID=A0ABY4VYG1_9PROT|nr:anhydro-N-acetylmuramic acid kinase [Sneathiella marina]USG59967.1 anhydro-N-acetylmuramic acid kinase [Sneathiella marina]